MESSESVVHIPYGNESVSATVPGARSLGTLDIAPVPALSDPKQTLIEGLQHPSGLPRPVLDSFSTGDTVALAVSDSFRSTGIHVYVDCLLDQLTARGIRESDIRILFSTGTHRAPSAKEQESILGTAAFDRLRQNLHCHDARDADAHVRLGVTRRGTPVEVNRLLLESDRVLVTGAVVLHYFGGYGGGRKSIVPGLASVNAIAANHAMNLHPDRNELDPHVRIASLEGNPVAEDMLEAARMVRVDAIINTVLDRDGSIAGIFVGELETAHREACEFAKACYAVPLPQKADLVIAASTRTRNFVQTHKALYNAYQAMARAGRIVLAAPCPEGLGEEQFTQWLEFDDVDSIIAALRRESEINGQTALSTRAKAPHALVLTELARQDVERLGARKAESLQGAIELALHEIRAAGGEHPTYVCMPNAEYTVPFPEP